MFESATDGQAMGNSGNPDPERRQRLREVIGGGLTFHVRAQGEDDFRWGFAFDSFEQGVDAELVGTDVV